jgi:serine/threonine protein phosphatase PrpC
MAKKQTSPTPQFKSYAASDQGIRGNNEDEVYADDARGIYFVIDGMGGHAAGEQAARIAKERLLGRLNRATGTPQQRIREAITLANNAILDAAKKHPEWSGMACVLTVALVSPPKSTIGHVGDSRLYRIQSSSPDDTRFEKITRDHSPIGELEDTKQLTEAEAMAHPRRNEVYRDVGSMPHDPNDEDFIDIYETAADPDSAFLLCSDGLTDALSLADIRKITREHVNDQSGAVRALILQAIAQGGKDNISIVLVQGPEFGVPKRPRVVFREVVPIRPSSAGVTEQKSIPIRNPIWQRIAWPALWIALGAALYFGAQQMNRYVRLETHSPAPVAPPKPATTIVVNAGQPAAQATIAAAMSTANEGDTIELAPGVYEEPVRIAKSNILLEGSGALLRPRPTSEGSDGITISGAAGVRIQNLRISGDQDGDLLTGIHIVDSQVTLRNVHVVLASGPGIQADGLSTLNMDASSLRDGSGPGLVLHDSVSASVKHCAIVGNGRDPGDREPGIIHESSQPITLVGNTIANNGGPAIVQPGVPSPEILAQNLFSLDGRKGRLDDVRVNRKRVKKP